MDTLFTDKLKPFSEDISTGTFFDPGDIQDDPTAKIETPIQAKPAFEYKGPIKKPDEITANDLKKGHTSADGNWIINQRRRLWDDGKLLQHHGYKTDLYNTNLLKFLKQQDKRWLLFEKNRVAGISYESVLQGLMKELGVTRREAGIKLSRLENLKAAKKLTKKEKEIMKKYHAGDVIRAAGGKPIEGFGETGGEFYHRDVGWY